MRKRLIMGVALVAAVVAAIAATMAFAGGDPVPTCVGNLPDAAGGCPSYRVDWNLGPPEAFQFNQDQVVGQATIAGLGGADEHPTIDIYAYNWGVGLVTALGGGGGGGAGKPTNQDFTIVKAIDVNTPLLAIACETGIHFPTATVVVKAKGGTMSYGFQDIQCSLDKQGSGGQHDEIPLEQFSWTYRSIEWVFTPKNGGAPVRRCFNLAENAGC